MRALGLLRLGRARALHGAEVHRGGSCERRADRRGRPDADAIAALRATAAGELRCVFSVDVLGEGVDVPTSTACCCCARPTRDGLHAATRARACDAPKEEPPDSHRPDRPASAEFRFEDWLRASSTAARADRDQLERDFPFCRPAARSSSTARVARSSSRTSRPRSSGGAGVSLVAGPGRLTRPDATCWSSSTATTSRSATSTAIAAAGRSSGARQDGRRPPASDPRLEKQAARRSSAGSPTSTTLSGCRFYSRGHWNRTELRDRRPRTSGAAAADDARLGPRLRQAITSHSSDFSLSLGEAAVRAELVELLAVLDDRSDASAAPLGSHA